MNDHITVACVLKLGGPYDVRWVRALKRGVSEHMRCDYDFVCLTDDPSVDQFCRIALRHGWPGWFSKVELFRPGVFRGPVLYLDLDSLIVGSLRDISEYRGAFAQLSDFYQPKLAASGVMAWTPGEHTERIYHAMCKERRVPVGRSDYWYAKHAPRPDRLQDLYPGQLVSFKAHCRKGIPTGARVVCFHGSPRPNDPRAGWGYEHWCRLTQPISAGAA